MKIVGFAVRLASYAIGYGSLAGAAISLTRFDGGLAVFWVASAYLTALLAARPRREWISIVVACATANILVTGFIGLGWTAAVPISAVNMLESVLAGMLIRRRVATETMDSLDWFARYLLKVGILAPGAGALIGSAILVITMGQPFDRSFFTWFIGHGLGAITFTPFFILLFRGDFSRNYAEQDRRSITETILLLSLFMATAFATFAQSRWPLLFFPLGPLSLICFRQDRVVASLAIVMLALVGAVYTAVGIGPLSLIHAGATSQAHFFQFYLASIVLTVLPIIADLRARRRLHRAVRADQRQLQLLMENSNDAVFHMRPNGTILYSSPSVVAMCGRTPESLRGVNALELVEPAWRDYVRERHEDVLLSKGRSSRYEYLAITLSGDRWFETLSQAVCAPSGKVEGVISVVRDVNERKCIELELLREARVDALTGLMNRHGLKRQFSEIVLSGNHCLAIVDIDHFKAINDRFGHAAGDRALQDFADVASATVRTCDVIARTGGEEFVILFRDMSLNQSSEACERLRNAIANSRTTFGRDKFHFTASIGLCEISTNSLEEEVARADKALYLAKSSGRDCLKLAA